MPFPAAFHELGLFVIEDFFDRDLCARLCRDMMHSTGALGRVHKQGLPEDVVDETIKRRTELVMADQTLEMVRERLLKILPEVERHFNVALTDCQMVKPVRYSTGDFYRTHVDICSDEDAPQYAKERKVAVVIFLNDEQSDAEVGSFTGGNLTFYGLISDSFWQRFGLPLIAQRGLLIAFPPTISHEVQPVQSGERFTLTTWFR